MLKIKNVFNIKLLVVVLCILSYSKIHAKELEVSSTNPCRGLTQQYEINFSNVGKVEWIIEGGIIISADANGPGTPIESLASSRILGQQYDNGRGPNNLAIVDWSTTGAYTQVSFNGSGIMSATFYTSDGFKLSRTTPDDQKTVNFNNFLKKITVLWDAGGGYKRLTCNADGLGAFGFITGKSGTWSEQINLPSAIPNFSLTTTKTNPLCSEGVQISGAPGGGASYNWNTSGGVIQNGGNWNTGIQISNFTRDGAIPISVTVSNQCNSVTKTITLNVTQPDFGHVTQNGTDIVDVPGSLVSLDCQGSFNLGMSWVSNNAIYTWELPGNYYDNQTNTYNKTILSGVNKANVQGQLPTGGLTDFVGKVTITGVCGAPIVKTFIIRPTLRPSVDADIYSCSNSVVIKVNNPTGGTNNINAWVASTTPSGGWGSFVNPTPTSVQFTASNAGDFNININIYGARGCYTQLHTTVHTVSSGGNTNTGTAGWQSGVLSDNRKAPGSNIVAYGGNIYFAGRDGKIYFYNYSAALQKWVINQIPGITNGAIPVAGAFTKIGVATIGTDSYLFFTNNIGDFKKINLLTNIVVDGFNVPTKATELIVNGNEAYALDKTSNILKTTIGNVSNTPLPNATLKTIITGIGVAYVQNNNLFVTGIAYPLTASGDVYASSDVVYYNGWLYYARGQKGVANLYRMEITAPLNAEQITNTTNLSGVFTINPASGVIYYGVFASQNTIGTVASGVYKFANIYQAHLSGTTWIFNAATQVKSPEGYDMYIQSPIYSGNHLYYVGAGHNGVIGNGLELEVWNLYFENACAPTLQRLAANDTDLETATEVLLYPNPFNTELSIDLSAYIEEGNLTSVGIEVVDVSGKTIYKASVLSELTTIVTSDWAQGVYVVKISHNSTLTNKKVVKY